jgi:hypothetical protein
MKLEDKIKKYLGEMGCSYQRWVELVVDGIKLKALCYQCSVIVFCYHSILRKLVSRTIYLMYLCFYSAAFICTLLAWKHHSSLLDSVDTHSGYYALPQNLEPRKMKAVSAITFQRQFHIKSSLWFDCPELQRYERHKQEIEWTIKPFHISI